jgi:hypothetical protein
MACATPRSSPPCGGADRGIPLPEVLPATGHAAGSVGIVLRYYDHDRSRQGELARLVAGCLALPRSRIAGELAG